MFWQKPLILLGLLAAVGSAAPLAPLDGDIEDFDNITVQALDKRIINAHVTYVWRTDGRSPSQIRADRGFQTKGHSKGYVEDLSLFRHCLGGDDGASKDNDGFVSTTHSKSVAEGWVKKHHHGSAYIYKIATDESLIDVEATLKHFSPYPQEKEFAAIDKIPWEMVQGWSRYSKNVEQTYTRNAEFSQKMYGGQDHGGAQFPLAGFPKNHPAWDQLPWARYAHCKPRSPSKRAEEIFANESPSGLDVDVTAASPLEARGRSRGSSRTSRKRPSAASRRKRPAKKTSKKTSKKTPKKTTKKPAKKCTSAMRKAGKCKTTKKTTCSAAQKRANGGSCPVTCSAAAKKKNGGVCPPKCSAAEKKKNGGKCPAKKGECGPTKTNKARYQEYLKAVKMNKGGKKMKWSEGTTGTKGTKGTKAGKTA